MTEAELNAALDIHRANEARRMAWGSGGVDCAAIAARLAREGWTPTPWPPVDPFLIEAREACAQELPRDAEDYRRGIYDGGLCVNIALRALRNREEADRG